MQIDAMEDGYTDHELFSLSSIKACIHLSFVALKTVVVETIDVQFLFLCHFNVPLCETKARL